MLENDLILKRFLDGRGDQITDAELAALESILQLNDNELWEMLSGRQEPADESVMPLLERLISLPIPTTSAAGRLKP